MEPPLPGRPPAPAWRLAPPTPPGALASLGLPALCAQLLHNRGLSDPEEARRFLDPGPATLHDPFLLPEMDLAVGRLRAAMGARETVGVYGDFDTDGVTATVILYEGLSRLGCAVVPYIPHRVQEGHGLGLEAVARLRERGVSLLVTVDTGITAVEEVAFARSVGMDVVVTDHHVPGLRRPPATAVVTSGGGQGSYPFHHLTGAGLALKLLQALLQAAGVPPDPGSLEMAAIGTVADMAPLVGENRAIAREGLQAIRRTARPGLLALLEAAGVDRESLDHQGIPFVIAPRINAAGRMDTADTSFRLLTARDASEAGALILELERLNGQRRRLTEELVALALPDAARQAGEEALLFLEGDAFEPGVGGLVASRMVEWFYRPAVVVSTDGGVARASGRSVPELDLAALVASCGDLLARHGGHPAAAGFVADVERLPELRRRLQGAARKALGGLAMVPTLRIDARVGVKDLLGETFQFLGAMAPFGQGNPPPVFLTTGVEVVSTRAMGSQGQHLRLTLREGGAVWDAAAFDLPWPDGMPPLDRSRGWGEPPRIDIAYSPEVNRFQGRGTVQLRLAGLRPARGGAAG